MQFPEGGFRIQISKQIRMQPLGHLLDRYELIGAVVELVPDGMELLVFDGRNTGHRHALGQVFQLASGFLQVGTGANTDPVTTGYVGIPHPPPVTIT